MRQTALDCRSARASKIRKSHFRGGLLYINRRRCGANLSQFRVDFSAILPPRFDKI